MEFRDLPRMHRPSLAYTIAAVFTGILLSAIFSVLVIWFRSDLRDEIHLTIIERDAAVLYPMALQQMAESEAPGSPTAQSPLTALLKTARQEGMLAVAIFDHEGNTIESVPATQLFVELPPDDFLRLQKGAPVSRYHPAFPLDQYFPGVSSAQPKAPVLEVLLPLPDIGTGQARGFVRYFIDARPLAHELSLIDGRINRQTAVTLFVGAILIAAVVAAATYVVHRAQRTVAERNEKLTRANFELTLSSKASAIGQITSHLIHGLQGTVEGLRAVVASREAEPSNPAWESAAAYTAQLQTTIRETIALLGDATADATYELTGYDLVATICARNRACAIDKGVVLEVAGGFPAAIDSHRGNLLCLITANLIQNAVAATPTGGNIKVSIVHADGEVALTVRDEGSGIPEPVRQHLFKAGRTGRPGGSGLGLAISKLLARQIGADLALVSTGEKGSVFRVTLLLEN